VYSGPVVGEVLVVRVRDSFAVTAVEQVRVVVVPVAGAVPVVVTSVSVDGQVRFCSVVDVDVVVEYHPRLTVDWLVAESAVERV
jgi:hypothetical protein